MAMQFGLFIGHLSPTKRPDPFVLGSGKRMSASHIWRNPVCVILRPECKLSAFLQNSGFVRERRSLREGRLHAHKIRSTFGSELRAHMLVLSIFDA